MEWNDFRVFLQVVRYGAIAAAASLGMDHSTISRRIARLESAARRLALTGAGRRMAEAAAPCSTTRPPTTRHLATWGRPPSARSAGRTRTTQ
jgi:DNA-binding transcriptional LysR family regulator